DLPNILMVGSSSVGWCKDTQTFVTVQNTFDDVFRQTLSSVIYHALPIAFIALMLRDKKDYDGESKGAGKRAKLLDGAYKRTGALRSGSVLVSTYMVQALIGLTITIGLSFVIPELLGGAGLFLPLGFGQGPPQSFAMGGIWNDATDSDSWQNFAMTIAAFGFLFSSIPGIVMVNRIAKRKGVSRAKEEYLKVSDLPPTQFEEPNEVPLSESIDKFTLQVCMVLGTYLITVGLIFALDVILRLTGVGFLIDLIPTFWGFAFMIAMGVAAGVKQVLKKLMKNKVMNRKYPNTYMMNRIAGVAFDTSIVCALMLISVVSLGILWVPIILMVAAGGVGTAIWLRFITKRVYPAYKDEAFLAMYGMLTGTIACGTILSREIDPQFKTPATDDMVIGSTGAVALAFPLIILVPMAANGNNFWWIFAALAAYGCILACFLLNVHKKIFGRDVLIDDSSGGSGSVSGSGSSSVETLNDTGSALNNTGTAPPQETAGKENRE
ncbi:MAG: hypothetical protein FWD86_03150, partial [Firmicutes bacterium]|nr:hypothetical protein [Bacillota bacterium]